MAETGTESALQRKMAAARGGGSGATRTVLRALRLALARGSADLFDLALSVIGATQGWCGPDTMPDRLGDECLIILLDGPQGQVGGVTVDRNCLTAIIQQQTLGKVTGAASPQRAFTVTDAALLAPLIDTMLNRATALADPSGDRQCLEGFRFGAKAEDLRSLVLALDADKYRIFELTLDFGAGVAQGHLNLILPEPPPEPDSGLQDGSGAVQIGDAFGAAKAELTAVICRMRVPLAQLSGMRPGDLLPLRDHRLDQSELVTISGDCITRGRLGQMNGLRAIRVNETHAPLPLGLPHDGAFAEHDARGDAATADMATLPDTGDAGAVTITPDDMPEFPVAQGDEAADPFDGMSPEEAAVQISELAGLPIPTSENNASADDPHDVSELPAV